ncbi:MAG: hypothetical protein WAV32_08365 [Halobacteriota archaeon]
MAIYYRQTTFQQRRYLFELAELLGSVSEACRLTKVSRNTYDHWEPRPEKEADSPMDMEGTWLGEGCRN